MRAVIDYRGAPATFAGDFVSRLARTLDAAAVHELFDPLLSDLEHVSGAAAV